MRFSKLNKNIIIRKENARMKFNTVQGKFKKRNKAKQNSPSYKKLKNLKKFEKF